MAKPKTPVDNNLDWAKDANTRDVVPDGTYGVTCEGFEPCEAKTGTPQVRCFVRVNHPKGEHEGKRLVDHCALTPSAKWRIATLVGAFGIDLTTLPKVELGSESFYRVLDKCVGRKCYWQIVYDEDYKNNKITDYAKDPSQEIESIDIKADDACPF